VRQQVTVASYTTTESVHSHTEQLAVVLLTCIQKAHASNLSLNTDYLSSFSCFSKSLCIT